MSQITKLLLNDGQSIPFKLPLITFVLISGLFFSKVFDLSWKVTVFPTFFWGTWLMGYGFKKGFFFFWGIIFFSFFLGTTLYGLETHTHLSQKHISKNLTAKSATLIADVVRAPTPKSNGFSFLVMAKKYNKKNVEGLIRLSIPQTSTPPSVGSRIQAKLKCYPIFSFANPNAFDYAEYMGDKGIFVRGYAGKRSGLKTIGKANISFLTLTIERLRQNAGSFLDQLEKSDARELIRTLVLGQKDLLQRKIKNAFSATGTAHLLAISGLHLGLVWGFFFSVFRLIIPCCKNLALKFPTLKPAALMAFIPCLFYAGIAGGTTPTVRALIMALCLVCALFINRPYDSVNALSLAGLLIALIWPKAPFTGSFQLSFIAVATIVLIGPKLFSPKKSSTFFSWMKSFLWVSLGMNILLGLTTMPLIMSYFHQTPLLFLPANCLVLPLIGFVILPLSLFGTMLGLIWPNMGFFLLNLALYTSQLVIDVLIFLGNLKWGTIFGPGFSPLVLFLIYLTFFSFFILKFHWRFYLGGFLCVLTLFLAIFQAQPSGCDGKLTAWVLDVGQGSSTIIRLPQGQIIVVDSGGWPGSDFDFGKNVIGPFLWSKKWNHIHTLVASHRHKDHYQGLYFLAQWFSPEQIWTNGSPKNHSNYGRLIDYAITDNIPLKSAGNLPREISIGGAVLKVIWPPCGPLPKNLNENDRSIWLGIGIKDCWIWITGDVGEKIQNLNIPQLPKKGEHILVAPHHGSKDSCTIKLLERLKPKAVAFSAGCGNRFHMPHKKALKRAQLYKARILSTIEWGALCFSTKGQKWHIHTQNKKPRLCP